MPIPGIAGRIGRASLSLGIVLAAASAQKVPDLRIDHGETPSSSADGVQIAAVGSALFATWHDDRNGDNDVFFNRSLDAGATWLAADVRLNTDGSGAETWGPQIAAVGAAVYVAWYDERNGSGDIYFNRSLDSGTTWLASDLRLDTDAPGSRVSYPSAITAAGSAVYVVWQDRRNGQPDTYFNRSLDNGTTWLASDVRLDTDVPGAGFSSGQAIAVSGAAVYVVWEDRRNGSRSDVYFNRSLDDGSTWLATDVRLDVDTPGAANSSLPKVVASGPAVYVVWNDFRSGGGHVYFNRSADSGTTWLAGDVQLDGSAGQASRPQMALAGSALCVVWQDTRSGSADVYLDRSTDGGATWLASDLRLDTDPAGAAASEQPKITASGSSVFATWFDLRNGRVDLYVNRSFDAGATWLAADVRADAGPGTAGIPEIAASATAVAIAWRDTRGLSPDVYLNRSLDAGATWLPADVNVRADDPSTPTGGPPEIATTGEAVYGVWSDTRDEGSGLALYFNRSLDRGATWEAADVRLDHGQTAAGDRAERPQIAASGASVYVVWQDDRNVSDDIYFNRSLDGGSTWLPSDVQIERDGPGASQALFPKLVASGSVVCVVWYDNRNGSADVFFNRSLDAGTTWLPADVRLNTNAPGLASSAFPEIAISGSSVYVAWWDSRNGAGRDVYFNRSLDNGTTWLANDVRLDTDAAGTNDSDTPRIAASGTNVHVVWSDQRGIYANRSNDGGTTWLGSDVRLDTASSGSRLDPRIAVSGSAVYALWTDYRNGGGDVYFNRSLDDGATWLASDVRLDADSAGAATSREARIAAVGSTVVASWRDDRNGASDVYFRRSADQGTTWTPSDVRIDTDAAGAALSFQPRVLATGSAVYVTWGDTRRGPGTGARFNLAYGSQPYGVGLAGAGGIVPALATSGTSLYGDPITVDITQAVGGAPSATLIGLTPASKLSFPLFGGTLLVLPNVSRPLALGGANGIPGAGSGSFDLGVPNSPNYLGLNLNFQTLILDANAVQGFALTAAVEVWIG